MPFAGPFTVQTETSLPDHIHIVPGDGRWRDHPAGSPSPRLRARYSGLGHVLPRDEWRAACAQTKGTCSSPPNAPETGQRFFQWLNKNSLVLTSAQMKSS